MSQEQGFLRFVRRQMQNEAQELDAARVTLRIDGDCLVVSQQHFVGDRLLTREVALSVVKGKED